MALTLEQIDKALAKAAAKLNSLPELLPRVSYGSMGGAVMGDMPNPERTKLSEQIAKLKVARERAARLQRVSDPTLPEEDRKREMEALQDDREKQEANIEGYRKTRDENNKFAGEILGEVMAEEAVQKTIDEELDADFLPSVAAQKPTAQAPSPAKPAAAPKPSEPAPAPTKEDVKELDEDVKAMRAERLKQQQLRTKQMEREVEEADKAANQREYNALTPAQKLELDVRSREQQKAANAKAAVSERRDQLAADEEYKGMQIASSGSFKRGDVTQYVDPTKRAAAQEYFNARAADLRSGTSTAGPAPNFGDRSLTVVDIDPRYGGGKGVGANPNFADGAKFGSDPDTMAYEMIGGKPTPVMTVGQAFATQSRGPGINQYEKSGTLPQQLDAMSAYAARDAEIKKKVDQMIGYQITGKLPEEVAKRAEEEKRKKEVAATSYTRPGRPAAK